MSPQSPRPTSDHANRAFDDPVYRGCAQRPSDMRACIEPPDETPPQPALRSPLPVIIIAHHHRTIPHARRPHVRGNRPKSNFSPFHVEIVYLDSAGSICRTILHHAHHVVHRSPASINLASTSQPTALPSLAFSIVIIKWIHHLPPPKHQKPASPGPQTVKGSSHPRSNPRL